MSYKAAHYKAAAELWSCSDPDKAIKKMMAARKRLMNSAEKRVFPNHADALKSTKAYVLAYWQANFHAEYLTEAQILAFYEPLSEQPTTWPDGPDGVFELEE